MHLATPRIGRSMVATAAGFAAVAAAVIAAAPANADRIHAGTGTQHVLAGELSAPQSVALQAEVDRYVAVTGGTQVGPNRIDLDGRGVILVAIPGERQPRQLGQASTVSPAASACTHSGAAFHHFCAYSGTGFTGSTIDMFSCGRYSIPWVGNGSWDNNQTTGVRARMYNSAGNLIFTTPPAHSSDRSGDWTHVFSVRNC